MNNVVPYVTFNCHGLYYKYAENETLIRILFLSTLDFDFPQWRKQYATTVDDTVPPHFYLFLLILSRFLALLRLQWMYMPKFYDIAYTAYHGFRLFL
jgi:hypothetical protein